VTVKKRTRFEPFDGFKLSFDIDFDHPAMDQDRRHSEIDSSSTSFVKRVGRGRTFGLLRDIETLRENGLAPGSSMVKAIGDLCLLGQGLIGACSGLLSGRELKKRLLKALIADQTAWEEVTFDRVERAPIS
jgi:UDP-3-O-[3-hydroxymyristoyl] N-acetylglucosamine deacetylase